MRPLFPESWRNETQIVSMVLSADSDNDPRRHCRDWCFGGLLLLGSAVREAHRRGARGTCSKAN